MGRPENKRREKLQGYSAWRASFVAAFFVLVVTGRAGATTVFFSDFDSGAPVEFSGVTTTESVQWASPREMSHQK